MRARRSRRAAATGASIAGIAGIAGVAGALLGVVAAGCGTAADVEEIRATQERILERLTALERNDQALLASLRSGAVPDGADATEVHEITVGTSPTKGPKDAPVTIVEFLDYECPFSRSSVELIDEVVRSYPQRIRLVVKQFPLDAGRDAKVSGTPTFVVQGKRVGTRSFEGFKAMIEAALDEKPASS